jgi:hypothetical protein
LDAAAKSEQGQNDDEYIGMDSFLNGQRYLLRSGAPAHGHKGRDRPDDDGEQDGKTTTVSVALGHFSDSYYSVLY